MPTADPPTTNANANATIKNSTAAINTRKRQRVVQLTVLSLTDIRVRVPPSSHSSVEQLTVGEGGAYHLCKEKQLPAVTASHNVGSSIQPFLDKVGLGLNGGASKLQQSQINANQRGNLSLSAAVSFSGSCPPQHMHVLSPALCSKTGRMIVESDPVLRHGEDVADRSIHSATHEADGTIAHVLVAKWDGADADADADADDSITGDGQRNDTSDNETAGTGGTTSIESSKSEHWRRWREATFRRMGSGSNISQPHVTVKLAHRPMTASDDGDAGSSKVYNSNSDRGSMSPLKLPPFHTCNDRAAKREECQQQQQDLKTTSSEGKNEDDANIFRMADGASVPTVLRVPSPLSSPTRDSRPTSPALSDFGTSTKPALPVSANLPDIIELNVELIVGRDLASNVDGDSGGILQPHDNSGSLQPIGGIAHLKLFPKDAPEGGSRIFELPVRKRPQSAASIAAAPKASNNKNPLVELGDNALLRVRIEIDSPKSDSASRDDDDDDDPSAIQWTLSGASAAVRAGAEEANGEEVSMAKLADDDATASDLLASDGATRRRGMGARRVPGAFCSGLSDISEMWEAFTKKVVLNCVDNCDDDALVYVNEDGGDSLGSTINTVYENIMY